MPNQAQAQFLPGKQGVFGICIRLLRLKVVIRLLEHGTTEYLILVGRHYYFLKFWVGVGISQSSVGSIMLEIQATGSGSIG